MLYRITYSELAKQEIENIFNYIVYDLKNVKAAIDLRNDINRKFKSLKFKAISLCLSNLQNRKRFGRRV